ncbi:MAG: OmpH family outer membrane protein [Bacteroidota bacterium]|nr:OmpH family outer membrane protein [Bacteroidota bacterium]
MQEENLSNPDIPKETGMTEHAQEQNDTPSRTCKSWFTFQNITNLILLIGLIVLYVLFFTSGKPSKPAMPARIAAKGTIKVVFVNIDTLNEKYEFVGNLKNDLEATGKKMQAEITSEQNAFEKEAADFQKQVNSNTISEERAKVVYQGLMEKQQLLVEKKEKYTQQVADKELEMNNRLLDTVTNFLKRYNRNFHYDYILGYKTAGEILLANDTLDITHEVIDALNKDYKKKAK